MSYFGYILVIVIVIIVILYFRTIIKRLIFNAGVRNFTSLVAEYGKRVNINSMPTPSISSIPKSNLTNFLLHLTFSYPQSTSENFNTYIISISDLVRRGFPTMKANSKWINSRSALIYLNRKIKSRNIIILLDDDGKCLMLYRTGNFDVGVYKRVSASSVMFTNKSISDSYGKI